MSKTLPWVWKFGAATAASLTFVIGIILSVKLVVTIGTGDFTVPTTQNFWTAFGLEKSLRLIFGLSLAGLAMTLSVEFLFSRLGVTFDRQWKNQSAAYFSAFFVVILVSTAGLFVSDFAVHYPGILLIAFAFVTLCCVFAAAVYGIVSSSAPAAFQH